MEPYLVVMVVVSVLLLLLWWGRARIMKREKEIVASRASDTSETFVASFRPELRPIASAVYAEFQNYTNSGNVPFRKSDKVTQILKLDKIDLDDALTQVAKQFACRTPSKEDDNNFRGRATFEDSVEFINHLKPT